MLSRVAESIYWIGRYLERTENVARIINVNSNLLLDLPKGVTPGWEPLIWILGCEKEYAEHHEEVTERRVVKFLISDTDYTGSIFSSLGYARENARTIREILPKSAWEELNALHQRTVDNVQQSQARKSRHDYLWNIISGLQQHTGLLAGTMNHDIAFSFLNLGKKLERADMTTRIINVRSTNPIPEDAQELRPFNDTLWMSMLESLEAYQMYRMSMQARINRADVLAFLFRKTVFPRSLTYCTHNIADYLSELPNNTKPKDIVQAIDATVYGAAMENLTDEDLHDLVDQLQIQLGSLNNAIANTYFPSTEQHVA